MVSLKNFKWPVTLALVAVTVLFLLFFAHWLDLTTADLGRHLKNGEIILSQLREYGLRNFTQYPILRENFYSFTEPAFAVLNHHWLSGVIFYLIFSAVGFGGLQVFFLALNLAALLILFVVARREAGLGAAFFLTLLVLPLLGERTEIRPEVFSYLLVAVFFYLLWSYRYYKKQAFWLCCMPVLQIFWVNAHIYFIFGPALVGLFWLQSLVERKAAATHFKNLSYLLGTTVLACLVNPFGWQGLLEPLSIFNNYGYQVLENKSVWFLDNLTIINNPNLLLIKLVSVLWLVTYLWSLIVARRKFSLVYGILGPVMIAAGWLALRNFALFALLILPVLAYQFKIIRQSFQPSADPEVFSYNFKIGAAIIVAGFLIAVLFNQRLQNLQSFFGVGLLPGVADSAEFFKTQKLSGPIFNDYDIGGYLIYYLFPQEKVFVDNRPEAYSVKFFQEQYVPMQENEDIWQQQLAKYNFNVIFFSHRDYTPWSQKFLIARVNDPDWAPVYVDTFNIIFLRRVPANAELIKKFELPKEMFGVKSQ